MVILILEHKFVLKISKQAANLVKKIGIGENKIHETIRCSDSMLPFFLILIWPVLVVEMFSFLLDSLC